MIIFLSILFAFCCYLVAINILRQFRDGFDFFSAALYVIIFLVCCGLLYIMIFGTYFLIVQ